MATPCRLARAVYGGAVDVARTDMRCARDSHRESSITSLPADGDSSVRAVRSLVDAFLAEDPLWQEWTGDAATILDVGDQEDHLVVAVRKGVVTFETISRDHRYLTAEFGREQDAWRFLIMQLGTRGGPTGRIRDINPRGDGAGSWHDPGTRTVGVLAYLARRGSHLPQRSRRHWLQLGGPGGARQSRQATATSTANRSSTWAYGRGARPPPQRPGG